MNNIHKNFLQLLQTEELENWQVAWQLAEGNLTLKSVFMEEFNEVTKHSGINEEIAYPFAKEIPALKEALLQFFFETMTIDEWVSPIQPYSDDFEVICFKIDQTGFYLRYGLGEDEALKNILVMRSYERFRFELDFDTKVSYPFLFLNFIEGGEYSLGQNAMIPVTKSPRCQGRFPFEVSIDIPEENLFTLGIQNFDYAELMLFHHSNTQQVIPSFEEWKKSTLEKLGE